MIDFVFFVVFILLMLKYYKSSRRKTSIPEGLKDLPYEKGLPLIGIFHQVKVPLCIHFSNLTMKYGSLFQVRMGARDFVVLNSYDVMKKALKDDGDNFAGRFKIRHFREMSRNQGILFHEGERWMKQRTFILNVFRDFGVNTSRYVDIIQEECNSLLNELEQRTGKETDFSEFSTTFLANIISKFVINKRFDLESEEVKTFNQFILGTAKTKDLFQTLSVMYPFLDSSTLFFRLFTWTSSIWKISEKMHQFFKEEIEEHLKKLDFNSGGEDLIDRFLIKQMEMKTKTGNVDSFTELQLIRNIIELLTAGFETLSTTLGWSLFFMSRYSDIQEKVHIEIMHQIGDKQPSMNDKVHLPYTQAVMDEILRMSSPAPLGLPHQTLADCSINGYFIPKQSIVFPNLYACHHDPNVWQNPMEFNPVRFMSQNENGDFKYTPREALVVFGMGKRQCLGESLAKMEYFIFFTRILQKFKIRFCEEISERKFAEVMAGNEGIVRHCLIKSFVFTIRN